MWLVLRALRRPVTVLVLVAAIMAGAVLALRRMRVDIFPELGSPTIYVAQPYNGMDPAQMEGYLTYYYEYHFLYITGIEHVESKNIQGVALMKLVFHPGTDMSQAMAQVVGYVNRARSFMPPGAVPPFIVRFDAGSVPIAQLVFSSVLRSPGEMQDIAINRVRPLFATLPGVSAPPPFGGNQRTIVVRLDPSRMRSYRVSPEEAIRAVSRATTVMPSGTLRTEQVARMVSSNAAIGSDFRELLEAPVRTGFGPTVYLRDIATVENGTDILTGYAHVNGRRTVYIPVTKRADASTLDVIRRVRAALPAMRAAVPEDVEIRLEFDQTGYVARAIRNLVNEGLLGALLTGAVVLLFLRDWRGALIVITTIPAALLAAVVWLWIAGQTINIMTLGGLALAVGVLVDETTVVVESIHAHRAAGAGRLQAILEAARKTAVPRLLAMLAMVSVFLPSFFMSGVGRQLFVPLSLAVGFAMLSSYLLSSTLAPVMAAWISHPERPAESGGLWARLRAGYDWYLRLVLRMRWLLAGLYLLGAALLLVLAWSRLGVELFPSVDTGQFQLRLRAPTGTRIEHTERLALRALELIQQEAGREHLSITTDFVGVQPASYPVNTIYLWTSGPHEAVLQVALKPSAPLRGEAFKERLRARFRQELPELDLSFEAGDIVERVMSFGSPTPIEVAVQGPNLAANLAFARKVHDVLARQPFLRDLEYAQPLDYPTVEVRIDRERAGQFGLTAADVARSLVAATSSSRFIEPNYWRDPNSGNAFQIQVEIPQHRMASAEDLRSLPVMNAGGDAGALRPLLGDVAELRYGSAMGMIERYNMQRVVSLTANLHGITLGKAVARLRELVRGAGEPPRGVTVALRGQAPALEETLSGLRTGLLLAIAVIFVLLAANFQSLRLAAAVMLTAPAAVAGAWLALLISGTTLNVQSYMGTIMALGVSVANAILLVSFAELARMEGRTVIEAAREGARGRLRPILMTASAMTAGMMPIALGLGEGGEQTAPLGRAVIGGLVLATFATLTVLPSMYAILEARSRAGSTSLLADESAHLGSEGGS